MLDEVALIAIGCWLLSKVREQAEDSPLLAYAILAGALFGAAIGNLAGRTWLWMAVGVIATVLITGWLTMCMCP